MLLLFASDLHGTARHYEGVASLARREKPDAVLLGGDLFSSNAPAEAGPQAQRRDAETWFAEWCAACAAPVYWIAGNHEWRHTVEPPPPAGSCVNDRLAALGDWDLIGFPWCSPTPYWLIDHDRREEAPNRREERGPAWASEGSVGKRLESAEAWLAARPTVADLLRALPAPRDWRRTILMAHDPPFKTGLDTRFGMRPVGSSDVRGFILERKPAISLHGHIHEAPLLTKRAMHRVGETWGFNAGRSGGAVRALRLDPDRPEEYRLLERA
jgi:Icc-related predicted phosphoesterase